MKVPFVRPFSILGFLLALLPLVLLMALNYLLLPSVFPIVSGIAWMVLVFGCRMALTGDHRRGIRLIRSRRFNDAIAFFDRSYAKMVERPWIDRYRWILMGGSSPWTYREMALCNIAFCYGQIGEGEKMLEAYRRALAEFPDSVLAGTGMRMIEAMKPKEAQPGATDNPDDAQRLREDH